MRSKEKLMLFVLFLMFAVTVGMFYYDNMLSKGDEMKNKVLVVVAKTDIAKGDVLVGGENANYGLIPLDKNYVFKEYIVADPNGNYKKELEGKKINSPLLKSEVITKNRLEKNVVTEDKFQLFVKPSTKTDVKIGDRVNVYVQIRYKDEKAKNLWHFETYKLMENRLVKNTLNKKDSRGKEMPVMEYIEMSANEKDSLNYHLAEQLKEFKASIVVLKYNDVFTEINSNAPHFEKMKGYGGQKEKFLAVNGNAKMNIKDDGDQENNEDAKKEAVQEAPKEEVQSGDIGQ